MKQYKPISVPSKKVELSLVCLAIHSIDKNRAMPIWRHSLAFAYLQAFLTTSNSYPRLYFHNLNHYESDRIEEMVNVVVGIHPNVLAVSCYIWNIGMVRELLPKVRLKIPDILIVVGGPEFHQSNAKEVLKNNPAIDFIVIGEGEQVFKDLVEVLAGESFASLDSIDGLAYRNSNDRIVMNKPRQFITRLDDIPSPYQLKVIGLIEMQQDMLAIETQRGCIHNCAYCNYNKGLSKLRFFSFHRVCSDLEMILLKNPRQLYLMDPTFNSDGNRAKMILKRIIEIKLKTGAKTRLNAEMYPENLDAELLELCEKAGMNALEVGIQSHAKKTLQIMGRGRDAKKLSHNLDLATKMRMRIIPQIILGLPGDTSASFYDTFDKIYDLPIDDMQIFHLSILPGTGYRTQGQKLGLTWSNSAPYHVTSTKNLTEKDISHLGIFRDLALFSLPMKKIITLIGKKMNGAHHKVFCQFIEKNPDAISRINWPCYSDIDIKNGKKLITLFYNYVKDLLHKYQMIESDVIDEAEMGSLDMNDLLDLRQATLSKN
ncbi:MAG: radical SAM protein [Candidatus Aminicenantes bacterium]|jgi:radical SAM superfamily enzyme YgiQ (UPF0313 family)